MSTTGRDPVRVAHDMIQQIADAIEAHADGLSMDDENDRRAMAEWIAENFNPKQPMGEGVDSRGWSA